MKEINYNDYRELVARFPFGKELNDAKYVHLDSLLGYDSRLSQFVAFIQQKARIPLQCNVIKFVLSEFRISFLSYPKFYRQPHPALRLSVTVNLSTGKVRTYNYGKSSNPPILHRKESFLEPRNRRIPMYKALTEAEEQEGLYENTSTIGFKKNWDALLAEKGLSYKGHRLIAAGDRIASPADEPVNVERHKTAITRYTLSKPIQTVIEHGLLTDTSSLFDFGCGQGDDVKTLATMGFSAKGWDPAYNPNESKLRADIVNLGFVLNVIEDHAERTSVLREAHDLADRLLVVSCLLDRGNGDARGRPYRDGVLSSRGTFQKYYEQAELNQYIEDALDSAAVAVGPGIFYVFKDPIDQQEFLSARSKRAINWAELSRKFYPTRPRQRKVERLYEENKELVDRFWRRMVELGRLPKSGEFTDASKLRSQFGTPNAARKLFIEKFGEETLSEAFRIRRNDLLVYFALANFRKKVPFKHLSQDLQNDIKTFLGNYRLAMEESREMLFSISDPVLITRLCNESGFGFFDHKAMYIHRSLIMDLHPVLRIYTGCAEILYGDLSDADIIKIHRNSGKVSLLVYDDFEGKPLPELQERVKINLRNQRVDFFDYRNDEEGQLLYFKELYVSEDHPMRQKWETFGAKLRRLGFSDRSSLGPSKSEFLRTVEAKGLTPNLNRKRGRMSD